VAAAAAAETAAAAAAAVVAAAAAETVAAAAAAETVAAAAAAAVDVVTARSQDQTDHEDAVASLARHLPALPQAVVMQSQQDAHASELHVHCLTHAVQLVAAAPLCPTNGTAYVQVHAYGQCSSTRLLHTATANTGTCYS
jgi:hypothetical protein